MSLILIRSTSVIVRLRKELAVDAGSAQKCRHNLFACCRGIHRSVSDFGSSADGGRGRPSRRRGRAARGVLTLQFENDYFVGEDRNYTHGMRFAYTVPVSPESLIARVGTLFPLVDPGGRLRATLLARPGHIHAR